VAREGTRMFTVNTGWRVREHSSVSAACLHSPLRGRSQAEVDAALPCVEAAAEELPDDWDEQVQRAALPLMRSCLKESMRLWPIAVCRPFRAWQLSRSRSLLSLRCRDLAFRRRWA
jgi:hypothetical protein